MIEVFQKHFEQFGFSEQTAIQTAVFSALSEDTSVLGIAPTGSGKTIAFTLPVLPKLMPKQGVQMLVLSPSQELAMQTTSVIRDWAKLLDLKVLAVTGGANVSRQTDKLKQHPEIVVGTPGRILHLIDEGKLKLGKLETMIIDEADDMLQDETLAVIEDIERTTPMTSQLGFFSATRTKVLDDLTMMFGRDIIEFDVRNEDHTQGVVKHAGLEVGNEKRVEILKRLSRVKDMRALVFFNQLKTMNYVVSRLKHEHVQVGVLGGQQRSTDREKSMRMFRNRQLKLLLTTDVVARGLDIAKLPTVINFDLPTNAITYTHRAGRTGRQGEPGLVINLGNDHDLRDFKKLIAEVDYELEPVYFDKSKLTSERPKSVAHKATTIQETSSKQVRETQNKDTNEVTKRVHKTLDPKHASLPKAKRRKKNKNKKDKGIRLKRQRQAAKKEFE